MLEQKNVTVKAGSSFQTICPFPVGYIYQSYNSTSPANIYGGSWTSITGRFLYCDDNISIGGENQHTLTIGEMPAHNHGFKYSSSDGVEQPATIAVYGWKVPGWSSRYMIEHEGNGQAHNNMPAYQSCYAWRRTN